MMSKDLKQPIYLFSIDLEDIRDMVPNGHLLEERVPANTYEYLDFLKKQQAYITFFVVGDVARNYPELIQHIQHEGHEIACHSDKHLPLDQLNQDQFKRDLEANITALIKAGASNIRGYRAPMFSLTEKNAWAYQHLAEAGITYSSSVLPADNFQFGWAKFGEQPKMVANVLELPMSILNTRYLQYPFGGGAYFRVLPMYLIQQAFKRKFRQGEPVLGYFHPYDIDTQQKGIRFPYIKSQFYNYLMYYNRKNMWKRLAQITKLGGIMMPYQQYIEQYLVANEL